LIETVAEGAFLDAEVPWEGTTTAGDDMALRPQDRCDRCSQQAVYIAMKEDMDLLFCGHHGVKHMTALVLQGWDVEGQHYQMDIPDAMPVEALV
jgi:hypothetical protein